ncbi:hypothetical protein D3C71_1076110 [compost metagenome]
MMKDFENKYLTALLVAARLLGHKVSDWRIYEDGIKKEITRDGEQINIYVMAEEDNGDRIFVERYNDQGRKRFEGGYKFEDCEKACKTIAKWL